jgi:ABC-type transport system involved in cytochrome c biogenesis permease subunit
MTADSLATLSDQLVLGTVLLYVAAMLAYALDLGFGRAPVRKTPELVSVGASGATGPVEEPASDQEPAPAQELVAAPRGRAGTIAVVLSWAGWAAQLGAILTRGLAVDRWPWGNMYEFVIAISFASMTVFLVMQTRYPVRFLGAFVSLVAALGLGFAVRYLYTQAGPVMPALNSYWIAIHVTAAITASGLFIVSGVSAALYLVRKEGASRLPGRDELDRVVHRAIVIGFPIWTFAVIAGAMWADKAWGRYWGWDPKEVWAFITWVAYAAYLHARATAGWKGRAAMIVSLIGFGCLLFNLIGVNVLPWFGGTLHSYSDVP